MLELASARMKKQVIIVASPKPGDMEDTKKELLKLCQSVLDLMGCHPGWKEDIEKSTATGIHLKIEVEVEG